MAAEHFINIGNFGPGYFTNWVYTAPTGPTRTALNFKCGNDKALHLNPRYDQNALVLNSFVNQQWAHEEIPPGFPVGKGQRTQITAVVNEQTMDIFANKTQFSYSCRHRYDMSKINQIHFNGNGIPCSPFIGKVLPDFEPGRVVYIKGTAPAQGRFNVNFVSSYPNNYRNENMPLHMSFRFPENRVVRNTKVNEGWPYQEENFGGMPLVPGQPFSLTVVAQKSGFEVGVNGSHFFHYRYKVPLTKEMCVEITSIPCVERIDYA